jgi:hypothetical protein
LQGTEVLERRAFGMAVRNVLAPTTPFLLTFAHLSLHPLKDALGEGE